jgi:hypothetical protein
MLPMRQLGRPRHNQSTPPLGATTQQLAEPPASHPVIWTPESNFTSAIDNVALLEQAVLQMIAAARPKATSNAYDPKVAEYYEFVDSVYPNDPFRAVLSANKVFFFMWYQAMRPQKKRGGKARTNTPHFDRSDYNTVMATLQPFFQNPGATDPPEPANPTGESSFATHKTVLRWIWKDQIARRVCPLTWEQIWSIPLQNLHTLVKNRRPHQKRKNYEEKVDKCFASYTAVEDYPKIEDMCWSEGERSVRSGYSWLRHRFCLLFTTSGILRCESLYKAELSDFLGIHLKKDTDPHELYLMIMQIALGK